jgi:hypothetical protein
MRRLYPPRDLRGDVHEALARDLALDERELGAGQEEAARG